jgi:hypothetical protein
MRRTALIIRSWLPLAVAVTLIFFTIYAVVQQTYRTGADDPQVQMARDAAAQLAHSEVQTLLPSAPVDIAQSQAPFMLVFNAQSHLVATNAWLNGQPPAIPAGVIDTARSKGENRVSWQPAAGVRAAIVAVAAPGSQGQVVVVGRSLREVEARESRLGFGLFIGWGVTIFATLAATAILEFLPRRLA